MNRLLQASLFMLTTLASLLTLPSVSQAQKPARYYSAKMQGQGYTYRQYVYYSAANGGYRYHVAVYHPNRPRYVYYYNPYKGRYWGRYDLKTGGYSTLAEKDRKATLAEIPESAFPPGGPLPPPEPGSNMAMLPPPEPTAPGGGSTLPTIPGGQPCEK